MKLKIKLLSDLCTYSGEAYNSSVDIDVAYDAYGFPYIPARRIKGCIREAMIELVEMQCKVEAKKKDMADPSYILIDGKMFERLFGKEGNKHSAFSISNACIENYSNKIDTLMSAKGHLDISPQKVLDLYTYTRSQTAVDMEKGTAEKNTLRTMRVVKKGLVFEAELTWTDETMKDESEEFQVLQAAASMVKHMGVGRTRGLGLVHFELLPDEPKKNGDEKEDQQRIREDDVDLNYEQHRIEYQIDLKAPVICKAPTGNQASTQDYLSGSKILGLLAGMIGQDGYRRMTAKAELIVSNAYILCHGKRTIPAPNSWQKQKDQVFDENDEMNLWEMICEPDVSQMQMAPSKLHYVDESGMTLGVNTEITYHHRRPDDKAIGRATGKDNSTFYQLESIQSGQSFGGYILANADQAKEIIRVAGAESRVRLGYSKNMQFGEAVFRLKGIKPIQKKQVCMQEAVVTLVSDMILYNCNGVPSTSMDCLKEYLQEILGLKKEELQIEKSYLSFASVGGYNTSWNTFKPVIPALGKGSVFVIHAERPFAKPENPFIGERVQEGFGEVRFDDLPGSDRYTVHKFDENKKDVNDIKPENIDQELLKQLKGKEEIRKLKKHIREVAKSIKKDANSFGTAVSKLRMIYQSVDSFTELEEQVESIASDSMRKVCTDLILYVNPGKLTEQYPIWDNQNEAYKMIYHIYLTELKYLAKILKEGAKEAKKHD